MKKLSKFLITFIVFLSVAFLCVLNVNAYNNDSSKTVIKEEEQGEKTVVSIADDSALAVELNVTYSTDTNTKHPLIKNNYIDFTVTASGLVDDETVTVYYTTIDDTAIASNGDYKETTGSVSLSASSTSTKISIYVGGSSYAVKYNDGTFVAKTFKFYIYDASCSNTKKSCSIPEAFKNGLECMIKYTKVFAATYSSNDGIAYFDEYVWSKSKGYQSVYMDIGCNKTGYSDYYFNNMTTNSWVTNFVNTGLANIYTGMTVTDIYNYKLCSAGDVYFKLYSKYNSTMLEELYFDYNRLYHNKVAFSKIISDNDGDLDITWNNGKKYDFYYNLDGTDGYSSTAPTKMRLTPITSFSKTDWTADACKLRIYCDNDDGIYTVYSVQTSLSLWEVLIDDTSAYATKAYIDCDHAYIDGYYRIRVQFNEPVQVVNGKTPYAQLKVSSSGTYKAFEYESGSGTDTLVFRIDASEFSSLGSSSYSNMILTGITEGSAQNSGAATSIVDFAYSLSSDGKSISANIAKVKTDSGIDDLTHIDYSFKGIYTLNLKDITVEKYDDGTSGARYSRSVRFQTDVEMGELYYAWTADETLTYDYKTAVLNNKTITEAEFLNQYYGSYSIRSSSDMVTIYSMDKDGNYLHGEYYLHVFIYNKMNKKYYQKDYGLGSTLPYVFDIKSPVITDYKEDSSNTDKLRKYTATVTDEGQGVQSIVLNYSEYGGEEKTITLWEADSKLTAYDTLTNALSFSFEPSSFGLTKPEYAYYNFEIVATDKVGNETTYAVDNIQFFDTRDKFEVSKNYSSTGGTVQYDFIKNDYDEVAVQYDAESGLGLVFNTVDATVASSVFGIYNLTFQGTDLFKEGTQVVTDDVLKTYISSVAKGNYGSYTNNEITITPVVSGRLTIQFILGTEKISDQFSYYLTSDATFAKDATLNATSIMNTNHVKSMVYQLNGEYYYYMPADAKEGSNKEYYNNSQYAQSFSSKSKALEYVMFYEKQDMYLLYLDPSNSETANIVSYLNGGSSSSYSKAAGETTKAATGQYWIRYKAASWTYANQSWSYYYYGSSSKYATVSSNYFSANLKNAFETISSYIVDQGSIVYLSTDDYHDSFGACTLKDSQIVSSDLSVAKTKSGSSFTSTETYAFDKDIYFNTYVPYSYANEDSDASGDIIVGDDSNAYFIFHQILSENTNARIFYCSDENMDTANMANYKDKWTQIKNFDSKYLDSYFKDDVNDIFQFLEMDEKGIRLIKIYIDHVAPILNITYEASKKDDESKHTNALNKSSDGESYGVRTISFDSINISEGDLYSYVTFYKTNTNKTRVYYLSTYLLSDIISSNIELEDGIYYFTVSDRYGNSYGCFLSLNDTVLELSAEESDDNTYLLVACNREESEIYSYTVYLGNELVTNEYAKSKKFTSSGTYTITVKDIYGNEESIIKEFSKAVPSVTWKYLVGSDYYSYKTDDNGDAVKGQPMKIVKNDEDSYYIVTSTTVQFTYVGDYSYKFVGDEPKTTKSSGTGTTVKVAIDPTDTWELVVYYNNDATIKVTYICQLDNSAPTVLCYNNIGEYDFTDDAYLSNLASEYNSSIEEVEVENEDGTKTKKWVSAEENKVLIGKSYQFTAVSSQNSKNFISSGDKVETSAIYVLISDDNMVEASDVKIYLDDVEISSEDLNLTTDSNGRLTTTLTATGKYLIVATDIFGNSTNIQFENAASDEVKNTVDGKDTTDKESYGNTTSVLSISDSSTILYMVGNNVYIFKIVSGELYRYEYVTQMVKYSDTVSEDVLEEDDYYLMSYTLRCCNTKTETYTAIDEDTNEEVSREVTINVPVVETYDEWVKIEGITDDIYVMKTLTGLYIKTECPEDNSVTVKCSVLLTNGVSPFEYINNLSKEKTKIQLIYKNSEGHEDDTIDSLNLTTLLVYDQFEIDESSIDSVTVERIRFSYSKTNSFTYYNTKYTKNTDFAQINTEKDGFYSIIVTNIYGNETYYVITKSESIEIIIEADYLDGQSTTYSGDYAGNICSNNTVKITLYAESGTFEIADLDDKGNVKSEYVKMNSVKEGNSVYTEILEEGSYEVRIKDDYGNTRVKKIYIKAISLNYSESLITGFNENGGESLTKFRKQGGYTNAPLSINYNFLTQAGIYKVEIIKDGSSAVVYDEISEKKVDASASSLTSIIGLEGDGIYNVIFRDRYGNTVTKEINYMGTPTLSVSVNYRSDVNYYKTDIKEDIWSNNSVKLETLATKSTLTVDGSSSACPIEFSFNSYEGSGSKQYVVYYVDEYGYEYTFNVNLLRQDISASIDTSVKTVSVNDISTTNDPIVINYPSDTVCTYTLNGAGSYSYNGESILMEGLYVFTATDKAGNIGTVIIKRDASVEYQFILSTLNTKVINGGVVTSDVEFRALNQDTSYISLIMKDGETYAEGDNASNRFTDTGKYEIVIKDEVGNETYFCFYLIEHALNKLEYTVPYQYQITDMWHTDSSGIVLSYLDEVNTFKDSDGTITKQDFTATEDGLYTVQMKSLVDGSVSSYSFTIDSTPSPVTLVGVEEGGTTTNDVTFTGYKDGDTMYIYRDGTLTKTVELNASSDSPSITEGGVYKIVVKNEAGVLTTLTFTRTKILNTYGSVLLIIGLSILAIALFTGLVFRRRSRIDK